MKRWRHDVHRFLERYRSEWAVAENTSDDARLFHADLERANRGGLVAEEMDAINDVATSLERIETRLAAAGSDDHVAASVENDARDLRTALRRLLRVQVAFVRIENAAIERRSGKTHQWMWVIGILGLLGSLALGLHVHHAIAPRIRRLVQEVQRFKELGATNASSNRGATKSPSWPTPSTRGSPPLLLRTVSASASSQSSRTS
jgi:hypothetical protein